MARTPTVDFEQVSRICTNLLALRDSHDPDSLTFNEVYDALGRRGASGRVNGFLNRFKTEMRAGTTPGALPELLEQRLRKVCRELADGLAEHTRTMLAAEREEISAVVEHAEQARTDAQAQVAGLTREVADHGRELALRDEQLRQALEQAARLQQANEDLRSRVSVLEDRGSRLGESLRERAQAMGELNERLAEAARAREAGNLTIARMEAEASHGAQELERMGEALRNADETGRATASELAKAHASLTRSDSRNQALESHLASAAKDLARESSRREAAEGHLKEQQDRQEEALRLMGQEAKRELDAKVADLDARWRDRLESEQKERARMHATMASLLARNHSLGQQLGTAQEDQQKPEPGEKHRAGD